MPKFTKYGDAKRTIFTAKFGNTSFMLLVGHEMQGVGQGVAKTLYCLNYNQSQIICEEFLVPRSPSKGICMD
jgi:hypothetical protein